jgi:hypothetical protein
MPGLRDLIKRYAPAGIRELVVKLRARLAAPPLETMALHEYRMTADDTPRPRLSLVIPSVAAHAAFGGVSTGLDVFLEIGRRTGADLRIVTDDFERAADRDLVDRRAGALGLNPAAIEIVRRSEQTPEISVRRWEIFVSYNWWTTLNIRQLLDAQAAHFGGSLRPFLYLIQEYEPLFYPFSSTHMLARLAFEPTRPCWGLFNSHELHEFFEAQGHHVAKTFVFEPKISNSLRPALASGAPAKARRILVYGRPSIPRNCFPAIEAGLKVWAARYPEFDEWDVVSAGMAHDPVRFAPGRAIRSLGKLSLEDYAELLRTTAVGISLMSSPHPSYPPLEMAHFGIRTITNRYANKDLASAHDNIISLADIDGPTIADALAQACHAFDAAPRAGWTAQSRMPAFLDPLPWGFLGEVAAELGKVWERLPPA